MSSDQPPPPPQVRVTLPDGQTVIGYLHERRQWRLAGWMYRTGLASWANDGPAESVEAHEYVVWLKAGEQVHQIEGVDYSKVPTYRLPREGQDPRDGQGDDRWTWKLQRIRPTGGRPGGVVVHEWNCRHAPSGDRELDVLEVLEALRATANLTLCKDCDASVALNRYLPENTPDLDHSDGGAP